jgi:tetratricopeptide (TPR) repeat protein
MMKIKIILLMAFILLLSISAACADSFNEPSWVYKGIGDRHYRNGEIGEAIVAYKKALLARTNETANEEKENGYPEVNLQLAKIYMAERLYEIAEKHLEIAEGKKHLLQIPDLELDILYTKAGLFYGRKNYIRSTEIYNEIIEKDLKGKKELDKYLKEHQDTLTENFIDNPERKAKFSRAYFGIAKIKYNTGNFDNAIPYLRMSLMYKYRPRETSEYLFNCYKYLNNQAMAEKIVEIYKKIM